MNLINFIIGIIEGNKLAIELFEILCLSGYLAGFWHKETRITKYGFASIIAVLSFDVMVLHCQRPFWVCLLFNIPSVSGWIWLYEKLKKLVRQILVGVLAFMVSLSM